MNKKDLRIILFLIVFLLACSSQLDYKGEERIVYNYPEVVMPPVISTVLEDLIPTPTIIGQTSVSKIAQKESVMNVVFDSNNKPILNASNTSIEELIRLQIPPFNDEVSERLEFKIGGTVENGQLKIQNQSNLNWYFVAISVNDVNQIYKKDGVYKPIQEVKQGEIVKFSLNNFSGFNPKDNVSSVILNFSWHRIDPKVPSQMYEHYVSHTEKILNLDKDIQPIEYVSK